MKKHSSISNERASSGTARKPLVRESQEVMSELVRQLSKQLESRTVVLCGEDEEASERPNLDRLTVGVDLGDQWSNYCILGLNGETLLEGKFRTSPLPVQEFSRVYVDREW